MTDPCHALCPFVGCASCDYSGSESASPAPVLSPACETIEERKTAPEECANTPEGLTTTDCVGVEMATPDATPLTGSAAANLDGCPSCVVNAEVPYAGFAAPDGALICLYLCADCGHRWHTSWAVA